MVLRPGTRLGVYEVTAQIGEGGMGQVYRATDTRLKRQVAIKILPPHFATDADRLNRFQREAEVLAALNHPHIAAIYGLEDTSVGTALVMEFVDGETLDRRIARAPIPVSDALAIASQIAEALEAAHEKAIVHRDLKPANIALTPDGRVKVLDFGLAKMAQAGGDSGAPADTPTLAAAMVTEVGVVLGTAAYMSPEQARGLPIDKRTDIWAFGCVVFELLTRRPAFLAATISDTIAGVLTQEPDWDALAPSIAPGVRRVLKKCLAKDPRQRLRDIGDARLELAEALEARADADSPRPAARVSGRGFSWAASVAAATGLIALGAALQWLRAPSSPPAATRLSLAVPGQFFTEPPSAQLSPDGRQVAFVSADASGKDMLWVRALDSQQPRMLPGTERANEPFWSPDSRSIGFFVDGQLKTVSAAGGPIQIVASAAVSPGASWNQAGTILFPQGAEWRTVFAVGGAVSTLPAPPGQRIAWPHFLPDGRHFLYHGRDAERGTGIYVGSLDSNQSRRLIASEFEGVYAPPGYLLFVREETLMAQAFDANSLELSGAPVAIAADAWVARGYAHGVFSAGANGTLAYVNAEIANTQLAWFDRGGRPLGTYGPARRYDSPPQLSPAGTEIAIARGPFFRQDLWLLDSAHETDARFTFDPAASRVPVWFRDGSRILFQSERGDGHARLYEKSTGGAGVETPVADVRDVNLQDVSPDGRLVVYMIVGNRGRFELWVLPLSGDRRPFPFLQTAFNNGQAQVSPDGRWIAYTSNESGRDEVYVQSFPTAGLKFQISRDGGAQARWRRSGGELFYLAPDRMLMAVPVNEGPRLTIGRPMPLFRTRLEFLGLQGPYFTAGYDVTPDGQRFLLNAPPEHVIPPIDIVLNWAALLSRP